MISDSRFDSYYQQGLSDHLQAQDTHLRYKCIDYASDLQTLNHYQATIVRLTRESAKDTNAFTVSLTSIKLAACVSLKLKILSLCRLALAHGHNNKIHKALKLLERSLQLSEALVDHNPQQGLYYVALVLSMMGKLYIAQRYYLFAMASFQASLDAYRSLDYQAVASTPIQSSMATIFCDIAHIAQSTHHPDVAIEHYLEALWIFNQLGNRDQMHQIVQQLNQLFGVDAILASGSSDHE